MCMKPTGKTSHVKLHNHAGCSKVACSMASYKDFMVGCILDSLGLKSPDNTAISLAFVDIK